jgi:predicted nucleic acid-binding protein
MPTFVDTNVFVYAVDTDEPDKRATAQRVLATVRPILVSTQVLSEYYVAVTRKLARPLGPAAAAADVDDLAELPIVTVDAKLVRDAVRASQRWQVSHWDALIIEAARTGGCGRVLSEDLDPGTDFGGIRVENPFGASSRRRADPS